jgi:hypothetical protein
MEWPLQNERALRAAAKSFQAQSELTRNDQHSAEIRGSSPQLVFSTAILLFTAGIGLASWMSVPPQADQPSHEEVVASQSVGNLITGLRIRPNS